MFVYLGLRPGLVGNSIHTPQVQLSPGVVMSWPPFAHRRVGYTASRGTWSDRKSKIGMTHKPRKLESNDERNWGVCPIITLVPPLKWVPWAGGREIIASQVVQWSRSTVPCAQMGS